MRIAALHRIEQPDRIDEEVLRRFQLRKPLEPRPAEHRAARAKPLAHRLDRGSRTQRKAAEIELRQLQPGNQLAQVAGQDALRIMARRRAALR